MRSGNNEAGKSVRTGTLSATQVLGLKKIEGHKRIKAGDSVVDLTHLDKIYWPDQGYSKADLIRYYIQVSRYILKYLKDRPAILVRYPNGISEESFYQQNVKDLPDFVETLKLKNQAGRTLNYVIYSDLASLLYVVNLGTIAQNPWHSRTRNLDEPDYVVIDLDPHDAPFSTVLKVSLVVQEVLRDIGMNGYPKTSGSSGIHVYIPISRGHDYDEAASFAERVSNRVASVAPKLATVERKISGRKKGQVYVDWQQNARGKSAASVYSVRAKALATVSAPVTWDEIARGFDLSDFTIKTVPDRLKQKGDLFEGLLKERQRLPRLAREQ